MTKFMIAMEELDPEHLLALIKSRGPIYDFRDKQYNNRSVIEELWTEIAIELNSDVLECKRKWGCLRNSYARYLRQEKKATSSYNRKKNKWYMAKEMEFLREFMKLQPVVSRTLYFEDGTRDMNESQSSLSNSNASGESSAEPSKRCRTSVTKKEEEPMVEIPKENIDNLLSNTKYKSETQNSTEMAVEPMFEHVQTRARKKRSSKNYREFVRGMGHEQQPEYVQPRAIAQEPENGNTLFFKSLLIDYENLSTRRQRAFRMYMVEKMNALQDEQENDALNE